MTKVLWVQTYSSVREKNMMTLLDGLHGRRESSVLSADSWAHSSFYYSAISVELQEVDNWGGGGSVEVGLPTPSLLLQAAQHAVAHPAPVTGCVTSGKFPNLSVPWFPLPSNGENNSTYPTGSVCRVIEVILKNA